jgi:catechol 2,3-dioxygenase-like lactoylglutathione lyase family enzyme
VLQTNQFDLLKAWYEAVFTSDWAVETTPREGSPQGDRAGAGGKQVFASDVRACFMRLPMPHPYTLTFAIFELKHLAKGPDKDPGLNHMQLKHPDLDTLIRRLELLRDHGIRPHRSANHGPATSFYFRDPDANIVELCIDNFDTAAEKAAFIASPAFQANPSGISLDPDAFIASYRSGASRAELLTI